MELVNVSIIREQLIQEKEFLNLLNTQLENEKNKLEKRLIEFKIQIVESKIQKMEEFINEFDNLEIINLFE